MRLRWWRGFGDVLGFLEAIERMEKKCLLMVSELELGFLLLLFFYSFYLIILWFCYEILEMEGAMLFSLSSFISIVDFGVETADIKPSSSRRVLVWVLDFSKLIIGIVSRAHL